MQLEKRNKITFIKKIGEYDAVQSTLSELLTTGSKESLCEHPCQLVKLLTSAYEFDMNRVRLPGASIHETIQKLGPSLLIDEMLHQTHHFTSPVHPAERQKYDSLR